MPNANQMHWQPISQMPLISSMIDTALNDTREHLGTLSKAKDRPHVLDDATLDRVEQVHAEQMDYVEIYTQQISRWRNEKPSAAQSRELDRMDEQNQRTNSFAVSPQRSWPWQANGAKAPLSAYWV
jgi:hypothetical protein